MIRDTKWYAKAQPCQMQSTLSLKLLSLCSLLLMDEQAEVIDVTALLQETFKEMKHIL